MVVDDVVQNRKHEGHIGDSPRIYHQFLQIMDLHQKLQIFLSFLCEVLLIKNNLKLSTVHLLKILPLHNPLLHILEPKQAVSDIDRFNLCLGKHTDEADDRQRQVPVVPQIHFHHMIVPGVVSDAMHEESCVIACTQF